MVSLKDFEPLLLQLSKLHGKDLVHSDVRNTNIIFTNNGGHLIDFDLVEREGVKYPTLYNNDIPERAPGATPSLPRMIKHDRISISKCMMNNVTYIPEEIKINTLGYIRNVTFKYTEILFQRSLRSHYATL